MKFFSCIFVLLSLFVSIVIAVTDQKLIQAATTGFARGNILHHGKNFEGGKPNGRFCDGKVPSDLFVEELGIKELLPPYLDPTLQAKDLITGVCFASAASGYDPQTNAFLPVLSIPKQLELFEEYIEKLKAIVGQVRALEILSNSLFIVITGQVDIQFNPASSLNPSYNQLLVNFASTFLPGLYKLGARKIGVFGVGPIGCLPFYRNTQGGIQRKCVDSLNHKAYSFNNKLSTEINSLINTFPDAKMVYIDFYNFILDLINNPTKYGYKIAQNGCCALAGKLDLLDYCPTACSNDYDYIFWDVSKQFDGTCFGSWRRGIIIALSAKKKTGFINGSYVRPPVESLLFDQWEQCNHMVISWILNSLDPDISQSIIYSKTAKRLWDELNQRYGQSNGARMYEV
ncbi:GDSL esterase/lipase EXL3-like [Nicotiana sylvestris]|uniref:GDSL esterase/lipase EXL3-like n=1 Tax=Nicotiana sylvestris TaxID=4096 RepID=UPI00388C958A